MRSRLLWAACIVTICAAIAPAADKSNVAVQGRYYRMKLVKIIDNQGFGQGVEVARLLLPSDWRVDSGVFWDSTQTQCPMNIIQIHLRAVAPDGITGVELVPGRAWQSSNDSMAMQMLQRNAAAHMGCDVGPVIGSIDYLRRNVVPRVRPGARVVAAEALPAVAQAKQAALAHIYDRMVRRGGVRSYRADAGRVRLTYQQNGQPVDEWMSATVLAVAMPIASTAAMMQGQINLTASYYSIVSEGTFSARAPAGKLDEKLIATIIASTRPNPQYQAAVAQFLANMSAISSRGVMDRARIWHEAGQQISATIAQSYQRQQAIQDRTAEQFSQAIRGVEAYTNPITGERVELTGGYQTAWVNNHGEYILSDDPGFDPAVALRENWTQMRKTR